MQCSRKVVYALYKINLLSKHKYTVNTKSHHVIANPAPYSCLLFNTIIKIAYCVINVTHLCFSKMLISWIKLEVVQMMF